MKKIFTLIATAFIAVSVNAQKYLNDSGTPFAQDKWYIGASTSSLDINWHKSSNWTLNLDAKAGYLFIDNWMITGKLGYTKQTDIPAYFTVGAGVDIDELSTILRSNTSFIYQKAFEKLLKEQPNDKN